MISDKVICLEKLCQEIPKAELHIHIEGTFEPELMFAIAERNQIDIPYKSVEEVREKYKFNNLQEFLDIYYSACSVLVKEEDFEDLIFAYITKAASQGLKYAEIFFDPQSHLPRGVSFETLINGLLKGIKKGKNIFQVECKLIMCFLRHLPQEDAFKTLKECLPYKNDILAVGLDSSEVGFPPELFTEVYAFAKELGFRLVAHAGEEGPCDYIRNAVNILNVERIDHGIRIVNDDKLLKQIGDIRIPLTLCPLSNEKLMCCPDLTKYPLRKLLENDLLVMLNSDDPAYFGGYIGDNYLALYKSLNLSYNEIVLLAKNSFKATFLSYSDKLKYVELIDQYLNTL
jgi:adenosine deaminase